MLLVRGYKRWATELSSFKKSDLAELKGLQESTRYIGFVLTYPPIDA